MRGRPGGAARAVRPDGCGEGCDRQRDLLNTIVNSAATLDGILGDLLDFSRLEAGKLTIAETAFDLGALVEEAASPFESAIAGKGLSFVVSLDETLQYLKTVGHRSDDTARAETRRYITGPGQATAYKIGMIRIMQLRDRASKALGPKFDIKGFNDMVIASGSLTNRSATSPDHHAANHRSSGAGCQSVSQSLRKGDCSARCAISAWMPRRSSSTKLAIARRNPGSAM